MSRCCVPNKPDRSEPRLCSRPAARCRHSTRTAFTSWFRSRRGGRRRCRSLRSSLSWIHRISARPQQLVLNPEDWLLPDHIRDIDPDLLASELTLVRRLSLESRVPLNLDMSDNPRMLRRRYYSPSYSEDNKCLYPWYATTMNPYGDIYPCSLQSIMGNVLEEPLNNIWNSERYMAFRRMLRKQGLFAQCARCCALSQHDWVARLLPRFSWLV